MLCALLRISILKTILFNLHYFGRKGLKFPVLVGKNFIFKKLRGGVKVESYRTANIRIGFDGTGICDERYQRGIWHVDGDVFLGENVRIAAGVKVSCAETGELRIGRNSSINVNSQLICMDNISLGENVMISWDDLIMDSDFHQIHTEGKTKSVSEPIEICDNVWICCRALILKGCKIPEWCVIAANSTIGKKYVENNCLISTRGIIKKNISWER